MEFCYQNAFEIQNLVGDTRFHVSFEIELPLVGSTDSTTINVCRQ